METNVSRPRPAPGLVTAKKTSVKRCLSPGSDLEDRSEAPTAMTGGAKRKSTDPALLLVQSQPLSLSQLDSQYRLVVQQARRDSDSTPTYDPTSASLPSLPSSSSCSALTAHSTSYTSWTKPVQGRRDSDSCGPNSSILDLYTEQEHHLGDPAPHVSMAEQSLSVRESSADTSKDVSDIESDWDEETGGVDSSELNGKSNKNSSSNNSKRSIFLQHKKIKKFSL